MKGKTVGLFAGLLVLHGILVSLLSWCTQFDPKYLCRTLSEPGGLLCLPSRSCSSTSGPPSVSRSEVFASTCFLTACFISHHHRSSGYDAPFRHAFRVVRLWIRRHHESDGRLEYWPCIPLWFALSAVDGVLLLSPS